jgi:hypothetical protein
MNRKGAKARRIRKENAKDKIRKALSRGEGTQVICGVAHHAYLSFSFAPLRLCVWVLK